MTFYVILSVVGYLLVGYAWAMLFMHKLTDGRWAEESYVFPGTYRYTDMGVGTAISQTVLWPIMILVLVLLTIGSWVAGSAKFFKKVYRIQ